MNGPYHFRRSERYLVEYDDLLRGLVGDGGALDAMPAEEFAATALHIQGVALAAQAHALLAGAAATVGAGAFAEMEDVEGWQEVFAAAPPHLNADDEPAPNAGDDR